MKLLLTPLQRGSFPQRKYTLKDICTEIIFIKYKEEILAITTVNEFLRFQTKPIMQINIIQITMKLEATWEDQNIIQIYGVDRRLNYTSKVGYATII